MDLSDRLALILVFKPVHFNLLKVVSFHRFVLEASNLSEELLNLNLVFLVLDVEVVEHLLLFGLCDVGVVVLRIEFAFPEVDFVVLLLDEFDEVLIFLNEVGILGKQ